MPVTTSIVPPPTPSWATNLGVSLPVRPRNRIPTSDLLQSFLAIAMAFVTTAVTVASEPTSEKSSFANHVEPIFKAKCYRCHRPEVRKADLDLSTVAGILRGGESGAIIDRDHLHESILYEYVHEGLMPPEEEGQLEESEIDAICDWIDEGAPLPATAIEDVAQVTQHDALPILLLRCGACHGGQRKQAELDIRSRAALLRGGKSGPAIVLGKPNESLLLKRIHAREMPPRKELVAFSVKPVSPQEIKILSRWIASGAAEETIEPDIATTEPDRLVGEEDRQFWAFQPPRAAAIPQVGDSRFEGNAIDAFILEKLQSHQLTLSSQAELRTLVRRAYFDLIGLPPEPEEVKAFVADQRSNAFELLVDNLLDSPRYGERWGQYWLDVAGYADSEGIVNADLVRKHAWRYRDYVIRSLNDDKPYDRFLLEQLAGDELVDYENTNEITQEIYDNLVATGFLRMAPDGTYEPLTGYVPDRLELIDDEIEVLGSAILGLTIKCARCHTHKFDPIPQRDYYRLAAIFKGALDEHDWLVANKNGADQPADALARFLPHVTSAEEVAWRAAGEKPDRRPLIRALWDRGRPSPTYILMRGNYLNRGRLVGPGVPSVLTDGKTPLDVKPPWPGAMKTGRRLAFAKWVIRPDHPLTARVMVNRIWKNHFGEGLVKTLDNFGKTGSRPTHPELLDWLAVRFVEDGWSIKSLHRLIMTSAVYQQSSQVIAEHEDLDPDNELLSRGPLRRMESEVLRDSLLQISGRLETTPFGPPDHVQVRKDGLVTAEPYGKGSRKWRRSIYLLKRRSQPLTILQNFDFPQMDPNCVARSESVVATQALHLNNNQLVRELATSFADRVWREVGNDPHGQIDLAFRIAIGRVPTSSERLIAQQSLAEMTSTWSQAEPTTRHEFVATKHLWIRETEPDIVYENDLVSVWSSAGSDKGRRFGLIEFDIGDLENLKLIDARLELGAREDGPLLQTASMIPAGIDNYTWNDYQREKADRGQPLVGLGHYRLIGVARPTPGTYVRSESASGEDLQQLQAVSRSDGKLTLVLMATEDGTAYRQDWNDGVYASGDVNVPRLVVFDDRPDPNLARRKGLENLCHALLNSAAFLYID